MKTNADIERMLKARDALVTECLRYEFNLGIVLQDNPEIVPQIEKFVELCKANRKK